MVRIARKENIFLWFSAIFALMEKAYPCPLSLKLLEEVVEAVGAGKVLWGSDIPTTLGNYTYLQMKNLILEHADLLSGEEKNRILGLSAFEFFNW